MCLWQCWHSWCWCTKLLYFMTLKGLVHSSMPLSPPVHDIILPKLVFLRCFVWGHIWQCSRLILSSALGDNSSEFRVPDIWDARDRTKVRCIRKHPHCTISLTPMKLSVLWLSMHNLLWNDVVYILIFFISRRSVRTSSICPSDLLLEEIKFATFSVPLFLNKTLIIIYYILFLMLSSCT